MGKYFGTDGFRGEANVDLAVEHGMALWKGTQSEGGYRQGYQKEQLYV